MCYTKEELFQILDKSKAIRRTANRVSASAPIRVSLEKNTVQKSGYSVKLTINGDVANFMKQDRIIPILTPENFLYFLYGDEETGRPSYKAQKNKSHGCTSIKFTEERIVAFFQSKGITGGNYRWKKDAVSGCFYVDLDEKL